MDLYKKVAPSIIIGSLVAMTGYYSYYGYKKCRQIFDYINNIKINDDKPTVVIDKNYMIIDYVYLNNKYTLRVPYNEEMVPFMANCDVTCMDFNGKEYNITQQPGVPYLIKPIDIDCHHITVYDLNNDYIRNYYNTCPFYGHISE